VDFTSSTLPPISFLDINSWNLHRDNKPSLPRLEKALLDLAHLTSKADSPNYLSQLRLQNMERLDLARSNEFAERAAKPKWRRIAIQIERLALQEKDEYKDLP
jgi:hypothetical protein